MTKHRVALVVFMEAEGETEEVSIDVAQAALRHVLSGGTYGEHRYARMGVEWPVKVGFVRPSDDEEFFAEIRTTMEAGSAIGNGYLWTHVTSKAFREGGVR